MEAPKCKLCGARHHFREPHTGFKLEPKKVDHPSWVEYRDVVPSAEAVNEAWSTRKHCPTCTCKRVYKSAAERQKAYRERHKTDER